MPVPLQPGAALETAVRDLLRANLGYLPHFCDCTYNDQPPPNCGVWYAAVFSDGARQAGPSASTCLDEYLNVSVCISVRFTLPFDRWREHRYFLEQKANEIRAEIARDKHNYVIVNTANTLAGYRSSGAPDGITAVGFCESLLYMGTDATRDVTPDHFHAMLENATSRDVGIAQTVRFGRCRRIQAFATAG